MLQMQAEITDLWEKNLTLQDAIKKFSKANSMVEHSIDVS